MVDERNEQGRFTPEHTDGDVLAAVRAHEPAATTEVAGELGIARQSADYRLRKLRDEGRVASKKIGSSLVWFAPTTEDTSDHESGRDPRAAPSEREQEVSTDSDASAREPRERAHDVAESRDPERETAEQRIRELEDRLEGDENSFNARLEATLKLYDHLRDADGGKRKSELKEYVTEHGIDTGYRSGFEGLWGNWIKANDNPDRPNLLTELPGMELRGNYYTYTGGDQ